CSFGWSCATTAVVWGGPRAGSRWRLPVSCRERAARRGRQVMKLTVVAVGKLKERHYIEACQEYLKRVQRQVPCQVIEVRTAAELLARCPPRAERWLLDERGRELTSAELAAAVGERMRRGTAGLAFLIGGADGVPSEVRAGADFTLALSRLTLAHRLARLVL